MKNKKEKKPKFKVGQEVIGINVVIDTNTLNPLARFVINKYQILKSFCLNNTIMCDVYNPYTNWCGSAREDALAPSENIDIYKLREELNNIEIYGKKQFSVLKQKLYSELEAKTNDVLKKFNIGLKYIFE